MEGWYFLTIDLILVNGCDTNEKTLRCNRKSLAVTSVNGDILRHYMWVCWFAWLGSTCSDNWWWGWSAHELPQGALRQRSASGGLPISPSVTQPFRHPHLTGYTRLLLFPDWPSHPPHCAGTNCFLCREHSLPLTITLTSKTSFSNSSLMNPQTRQGSLPSSLSEQCACSARCPASWAWVLRLLLGSELR